MPVLSNHPKIMIVDDTPANLNLLQEILQAENYHIMAFPRGSMALSAAVKNPPDMILLDIRMPEMDGFEVCRRLKETPSLKDIPVIFISALSDTEDKLKAFSAGGVDYVTKPFHPEEIHARIKTHLHLQRLLRESEQRQEVLIGELPDIVIRFDKEARHLFVSGNIHELYGQDAKAYRGKTHRELFFPEEICEFWEDAVNKVFDTAETHETEKTFTGKGPAAIHNLRLIPEYDVNGKIQSALAISRDITASKMAEKALLQAKEAAEAANLVKSEFLANMSHELRTPLNGILGVMHLLQGTDLEPDDAEILNLGIHSAQRLTHLLTDIMDFSAMDAKRVRPSKESFEPEQVCKTLEGLFSLTALEKKIHLDIAMDPATPSLLVGDGPRLRQILGNAFKFTKNGSIRLEILPLSPLQNEKAHILFILSDTGIGISRDLMDQIWEPFRQADGSSTRSHEGAGLGLALIRRLVLMLGGTLCMDSLPGKGTEVFLLLPFDRSH
ncbi:PAS domain S-box-containing protein [Desulfobotulus alkaliphilus]|uniref:histidine kinase n=2 Tax=Desulfobotulus alkaliphilus TaxID=622671 RepID=A0A562RHN7_9BACT|nr:PAS domain S-box-containing protein [Desulfobotulus alkaliphilus]